MAAIVFSPLTAADVAGLAPVSAEGAVIGASPEEVVAVLVRPDLAWAGRVAGRLVGAAGLVPIRAGTLMAWAYLDPDLPRVAWRRIVPFMRGILDLGHARGYWRIECAVRTDLRGGHKLVHALGFAAEGIALAWAADRSDALTYSRIDRGCA